MKPLTRYRRVMSRKFYEEPRRVNRAKWPSSTKFRRLADREAGADDAGGEDIERRNDQRRDREALAVEVADAFHARHRVERQDDRDDGEDEPDPAAGRDQSDQSQDERRNRRAL